MGEQNHTAEAPPTDIEATEQATTAAKTEEEHSPLVLWLAEQDVALASAVEELEKRRPDRFKSVEEQMLFLEELATITGRREELNLFQAFVSEQIQPEAG